MRHRPLVVTILFSLFCVAPCHATDVDYLRDIKPLLAEKCYACHGALAQESSLRLETRQLMIDGGDSGTVIVPGMADRSSLVERIIADGFDRMPPPEEGSALTTDQVQLLREWIDQGAKAPVEEVPLAPSEHWAFQPIQRSVRPKQRVDPHRQRHPIDALLQTQRDRIGLTTVPMAERSLQIRRLYLDLIGLPPTLEQLQDARPWTDIVDELLVSPQHGERWARHWMDIWRYCDWYGLGKQLRYSQKHMWRWRDWIVDSLNADKGYDRMILEMIAGDELDPVNPDVVVATGYLARNYYLFNRTTWLDNTIEHTSKAFLGLTMNCSKCHDHKYDPLSQLDYYRMRAIFEPHQVRLDPVPGTTDFEKDGLPRVFDDHTDALTYVHRRGDPKSPETDHPIQPGVPDLLSPFAFQVEKIDLPVESYAPSLRSYVYRDRLNQLDADVTQAETDLTEAIRKMEHQSARPSAIPESEAESNDPGVFEFTDSFDELDTEIWSVIGPGWEHYNGSVRQTLATRETAMLRFNRELPRDFELTCRYTTTGGSTYKSVTFRLDQSDDLSYANYVYTSAHAPGPKVQAAYTRDGKSVYPSEARRARRIEIGKPYTLRMAIRGKLVNVWLDGEFQFAYQFPDRRAGFLSLSGFDATVAFDSIAIRSLDSETELQSATGASNEVKGRDAVAIAKAKRTVAQARRDSFVATWKADRASLITGSGDAVELSRLAAQRQMEETIAECQLALIEKRGDAKALAAANKRLTEATNRFATLDSDPPKYESIRSSLKALESPAHQEAEYPAHYSSTSTGRRLAFARWLSSEENPLTARVAVNHVWLRHFGAPLVDSVFDFGLRTKEPLQTELLDYLASEFIASGWSFRHLHRLIVTSKAYRLSSSTLHADEATKQKDPANQYFWRMNPRRMESQVVRDSLLQLADQLDTTVGGPAIDPSNRSRRRSLYFKHSRDQQDKFLEMFDDADELQCYRRSESIVPQQALALSNSKLALQMAKHIAERLSGSNSTEPIGRGDFIQAVFRSLLGRSVTHAELSECDAFFEAFSDLRNENDEAPSERKIRERFVHAILNHNDFVTVR